MLCTQHTDMADDKFAMHHGNTAIHTNYIMNDLIYNLLYVCELVRTLQQIIILFAKSYSRILIGRRAFNINLVCSPVNIPA
jgi:hypothetical protein